MIVAHRGDTSAGATENSLDAIQSAMETGADMIEIDLQWTNDEVFVCYHDEMIVMPDGSAKALHTLDLKALSQRGVKSLEGYDLLLTPLLSILELTKGKIYLNLEIKEYSDRDPKRFVQALERLIEQMGMTDQVLISSFRLDHIREVAWTIPSCIIQPSDKMMQFFMSRSKKPETLPKSVEALKPSEVMAAAHATTYACMLEELSDQRIRDIKARNLHLSVYTISTDSEFKRAVQYGAKAVVCEQPAHFVKLRDSLFQSS